MSKYQLLKDYQFDLFELFFALWNAKWKIIATTFIAALIGVALTAKQPNLYVVSTPIQSGKQSVFLPFTPLNNLLKDMGFLYDAKLNTKGYIFDNDSVFEMFVVDFNDYEEMVSVLSENDFVNQSIKDLDEDGKQRALISFAKAFKIISPSDPLEKNGILKFQWHDDFEGRRLFNNAIKKTLLNVKKVSQNNIDELAKSIQIQNSNKLEKLYKRLDLILQSQNLEDTKTILYLKEQSEIAKELGIKTNKIDTTKLSRRELNGISLSVSSTDIPYYLRGYTAINKEIMLIENRSDTELLAMTNDYVQTMNEIALIENDLSSTQLRANQKLLEIGSTEKWVEFDLALANSQSMKKTSRIVFFSSVLGLIIAVCFILAQHIIRKYKELSAKL